MIDNPIVEEVHRIREQMLAEFDGDMDALVKDLQRKTEQSAAAGRRVVASLLLDPPFPGSAVRPLRKINRG